MLTRREFLSSGVKGTMVVSLVSGVFPSPSSSASDRESPGPPGRTKLLDVLESAGKPAETVRNPDGTVVVLLPYGGRVLGLYPPESGRNFYWTNPALAETDTARRFFESDQWQNTGGDRTWLAPEVDFFFPDYPDLGRYVQPRQLDPGKYRVGRENGRLTLVNRLTARLSRSQKTVELEITKSVGPAPNPLRYEKGWNPEGLEYAGYTQSTTLKMLGNPPQGVQVGLWNLIQMPHGGDLLIPTYSRTDPKVYFGKIPDGDLLVDDHRVRFRMRGKGEYKIGIRAVAATGRVGYLYSDAAGWNLIVRSFHVDPSGEYIDVPWKDPADKGYSTQACNIHSSLGSFSELEYHVPAIGDGTRRTFCEDVSQIWAFRGPESQILRIAETLLSAPEKE